MHEWCRRMMLIGFPESQIRYIQSKLATHFLYFIFCFSHFGQSTIECESKYSPDITHDNWCVLRWHDADLWPRSDVQSSKYSFRLFYRVVDRAWMCVCGVCSMLMFDVRVRAQSLDWMCGIEARNCNSDAYVNIYYSGNNKSWLSTFNVTNICANERNGGRELHPTHTQQTHTHKQTKRNETKQTKQKKEKDR